jgi:large subunit ribosomal protein L21e
MHEFKPGDRVAIVLDGAQQQGMPHRRFQGKVGTVVERQGRAYVVNFYDGNMAKTVIARPEHLRAMAMEE